MSKSLTMETSDTWSAIWIFGAILVGARDCLSLSLSLSRNEILIISLNIN